MMNLERIQTQDLAKVFGLKKKIAQREQKQLPVESLSTRLQALIESSIEKTATIAKNFKPIEIPSQLPIADKAEDIKKQLIDNQVIIVAGETGCGKTTQLAKLCIQAGFGDRGIIAHTQPRRVAAMSVAKRIADEVESPIGEMVGYSVRFNQKLSDKTRVKIMTDGVLLTELQSQPLLSAYQVIIIDEAHERSLNIDFLLGFLKQILAKRKELKVIITSATIDLEKFSQHFSKAPIIHVEGRGYPIDVRYRPALEVADENDSVFDQIIQAVDECIAESNGDILIFSDGEGQIKQTIKALAEQNYSGVQILPLYARLTLSQQQQIFNQSQKRKIIVSTNVAETSLTVPGIVFVIDLGMARISRFSQRNKVQQLPVEKISKASADQRKGRCGRVGPGICIRLYSEEDYRAREDYTSAEIQRTHLTWVALRLKALGVKDISQFPFMQKPQDKAWKIALNSLYELGAIDKQENLTTIGKKMDQLPLDPQLARILVDPDLVAIDEMLIICAFMSVKEVRERPHDRQQKADQLHRQYQQKNSDILTAINLWKTLQSIRAGGSSNEFKNWCRKNLINFLGWLEWKRVYQQLKESLELLKVHSKKAQSECHDDDIHRALIPGFITHILNKTQEGHYQGVRGLKVWTHPSSLSFSQKSPWLLSLEMIETNKLYARMNSPIQSQWVATAVPQLLKNHYYDIHWRKKSGQVMAYLNQTLLGLPIVNKKLVNYSSVDSKKSRCVFLEEGLAKDQIDENLPFLAANRKKLQQLEDQEQRHRVNDVRINDDQLAELYDQALPKTIVSVNQLKKWLKQDFKKNNQQLSFSLELLRKNTPEHQDDFPATIQVKGVELNLSYSFSPGTKDDGVSVEIPAIMLSQFNDRDFDWLVPGYLQEKVFSTIKSLPKSLRKSLFPLNEIAQKSTQELLGIDTKDKLFIDELSRVLKKLTGCLVNSDDFDLSKVDAHLSMKYKIIGENSPQRLSSLKEVNLNRSSITKENVALNQKNKQRKNYTKWDFGDFKIENIVNLKEQQARVFLGLYDAKNHVEIRQFPSRSTALLSHTQGVARLVFLHHQSVLNQFFS